jgi:hypothetical protein
MQGSQCDSAAGFRFHVGRYCVCVRCSVALHLLLANAVYVRCFVALHCTRHAAAACPATVQLDELLWWGCAAAAAYMHCTAVTICLHRGVSYLYIPQGSKAPYLHGSAGSIYLHRRLLDTVPVSVSVHY